MNKPNNQYKNINTHRDKPLPVYLPCHVNTMVFTLDINKQPSLLSENARIIAESFTKAYFKYPNENKLALTVTKDEEKNETWFYTDNKKQKDDKTSDKKIRNELQNQNKPTQIRKFYDEVVKLHDRCQQYNRDGKDGFAEVEIYVHMLPAKSKYAKGREHVSFNFDYFIKTGVKQITCAESLYNFKLLFESVLGFYKEIRPKN